MRYDSDRREIVSEGQLKQNPPAELIREISESHSSGALRLGNDPARAVVYFEEGTLVFAASNLRSHRLAEILKRSHALSKEQFAKLPPNDEELANLLLQRGLLTPEVLLAIRANQVTDILRSSLLWTDGTWEFDSRVRIAGDTHVAIDLKGLLLECARHLPDGYIPSRFVTKEETVVAANKNGYEANLLPPEAFVLSRVAAPITLTELYTISGLGEGETVRVVYGLSLCGLLQRSHWPVSTISTDSSIPIKKTVVSSRPAPAPPAEAATSPIDEEADLNALFARLDETTDYYDVLGIDRQATIEQVKSTYHSLARRYHPDRFHQNAQLRSRVDAAFARIARAYETLSDGTLRAAYDTQYASKTDRSSPAVGRGGTQTDVNENQRATSSFQQGLAALRSNKQQEAIRLFAAAANLEPRNASYRAHYGHALIANVQTRRAAEIELKAAIALEPNNASFRVMLAELYKVLGLYRRAESEAQRALVADPKNEAARLFLSNLKT